MRAHAIARLAVTLLASAALAHGALAQQDTTRNRQDTTRQRARRHAAGGEVALGARASVYRGSYGLQRDQVRQLQTSLREMGCNPGPIDGVMGPRTHRAMMCARDQKGLQTSNVNDLLRSMNLGFTAQDSIAGSQGMRGNQGRIRPPADSVRGGGERGMPPAAAQRGRGMHNTPPARRDSMRRDTTRSDTSSHR